MKRGTRSTGSRTAAAAASDADVVVMVTRCSPSRRPRICAGLMISGGIPGTCVSCRISVPPLYHRLHMEQADSLFLFFQVSSQVYRSPIGPNTRTSASGLCSTLAFPVPVLASESRLNFLYSIDRSLSRVLLLLNKTKKTVCKQCKTTLLLFPFWKLNSSCFSACTYTSDSVRPFFLS